jgi:protein-S-isoprenylcysteine O-methyltransferase Ste14
MALGSSASLRQWWTVASSLVQLLGFWIVFLFLVPIAIAVIEIELGIQRFVPMPLVAFAGLIVFTLLGLWAATTLALVGGATPLSARPRRLVTRGPYAYVRNPLAIACLGQGTSIVLAIGSIPVAIYVTLAGTVYYFLNRPREERRLEERFGGKWIHYARHVRAWRPRLTAYRWPISQSAGDP